MAFRGENFERCLGQEDGALVNGISVVTKEAPGNSLIPSAMRGYSERAICEPENGLSLNTKSASALILDFLASRTVGNKCLLFMSHQVYVILL